MKKNSGRYGKEYQFDSVYSASRFITPGKNLTKNVDNQVERVIKDFFKNGY